ncbi:MAG: flagellar biosynthesis protein FliQ [Ruminococcus sp.]|nr:flagellar biosynthesis protein FliQ [Ruminococcus sp.]MBR1752131.1 flagellar biosynthesis protein FliQ [Ruminococcus sp.]
MTSGDLLTIFSQAFTVVLKIAGPLLIASIIIGLIVAIFQAATQIHEQTLTFVPKLIIIALILLVAGTWMMTLMDDFFKMIFDRIANL